MLKPRWDATPERIQAQRSLMCLAWQCAGPLPHALPQSIHRHESMLGRGLEAEMEAMKPPSGIGWLVEITRIQ